MWHSVNRHAYRDLYDFGDLDQQEYDVVNMSVHMPAHLACTHVLAHAPITPIIFGDCVNATQTGRAVAGEAVVAFDLVAIARARACGRLAQGVPVAMVGPLRAGACLAF